MGGVADAAHHQSLGEPSGPPWNEQEYATMAEIKAPMVAELRKRTGASMMECKRALVESNADQEKAYELLRKRGVQIAAKKSDRETNQGFVGHYIHGNGKIGVLVEVACETDFSAKNETFQTFIRDLAMHICAFSPLSVAPEDLDPGIVNKEREIYLAQVQDKPENIREKIVEGKLQSFYSQWCLLQQPFVKDDKRSVQEVLTELIAMIGENIVIRRFARLELGQE